MRRDIPEFKSREEALDYAAQKNKEAAQHLRRAYYGLALIVLGTLLQLAGVLLR